jgi:hypothetical protein
MCEHQDVVQLPGVVTNLLRQQRLPDEPQPAEQRRDGLLVGEDLDSDLRQTGLHGGTKTVSGQGRSDAFAAVCGIHHQAKVTNMPRPAQAGDDGEQAGYLTISGGDEQLRAPPAAPTVD